MSDAPPIPFTSPMPAALAGSTVVIAGGSSGIGLGAALLLRSVGARVVLVGRSLDRLEAALKQVRDAGPGDGEKAVLGVPGDGGDEQVLLEAFDKAGEVDHLFVTVGSTAGLGPLTEMSLDDLKAGYDARMPAAYSAARVAATRLPPGGSLTLSSGALVVRPAPGMTAGVPHAGAVETLTRAVGIELAAKRVRVNCIRFGRIDTPLLRSSKERDTDERVAAAGAGFPLGRYGTAEEAGALALCLMANNFITGQIFTIDGGETMGQLTF